MEPSNNGLQQPASFPKTKTKLWKKIVIAVLVVVILVLGFSFYMPVFLTLCCGRDSSVVNDSDLRLAKASVPPDSQNGYYYLDKMNSYRLYSPKVNDLEYTDFTKRIQWDQAAVDEALAGTQQALELFDEAAAQKNFQVPEFSDPVQISNPKLIAFNSWRQAARFQAIKAMSLSRQGKTDEALNEAVKISELGNSIINSYGTLIEQFVGISIQKLGAETLLHILPYGNPTPAVLQNVQSRLQPLTVNTTGYQNLFKFEYLVATNALREEMTNETSGIFHKDTSSYPYYYKQNETQNLMADYTRQEIQAVGKNCELIGLPAAPEDSGTITFKDLFIENFAGKKLSVLQASVVSYALVKQCENDLVTNVAIAELALKQYQIQNGKLPAQLSDAFPSASDVPKDPFDGQPLRYSESKKILYSVGLNKKDLGGGQGTDWTKMDNPTFVISF